MLPLKKEISVVRSESKVNNPVLQWPLVENIKVVGYYNTRYIQYCSSWRRGEAVSVGDSWSAGHTNSNLAWNILNILYRERISHLGHCSCFVSEIISLFWPHFQKPGSGGYRAPQAPVCSKGRPLSLLRCAPFLDHTLLYSRPEQELSLAQPHGLAGPVPSEWQLLPQGKKLDCRKVFKLNYVDWLEPIFLLHARLLSDWATAMF